MIVRLLGIALALVATPAAAQMVRVDFTATDGRASGWFTYDRSVSPFQVDHAVNGAGTKDTGHYSFANFTYTLDGVTKTSDYGVEVGNGNGLSDSFLAYGYFEETDPLDPGFFRQTSFGFSLFDQSGTTINSFRLPAAFTPDAESGSALFFLTGFGTGGVVDYASTINFSFTQITGAVPEPASWAMMIAGFGIVGGTLRRRRKLVLATV